ncbi:uncharacterized protein LOC131856942 [Cryptomeria japonica]|uniref:uncharacterized protein LOC131856942 n=1 Tax=Cryptomeria japonica TaxID=3369 RepID=UPI0027D9ECD1|nr:uncharacterized protein LOC131856942 [Cryptomeria japonica]
MEISKGLGENIAGPLLQLGPPAMPNQIQEISQALAHQTPIMNPIPQLVYQPQQPTNQLVLHPGPPISQIPPKQPVYLVNIVVSSRTQEEKDEMRELTNQMKKLSSEVTYLRNQNNQLQNNQRNQQQEAALSHWCRLHNTNQHSELQCDEFQVAANIFQREVENTVSQPALPPTGFEIVPSPRYDTALVLETYIPPFFFPNQDENEVADPNQPADVNAFQQYQRGNQGYYNNNNQNSNNGPYTTSTPKDIQVPPDQNANNNPSYPKAPQ